MKRSTVGDLRAVGRLAVDATERVTRVVEGMHQTIGAGPAVLGRPLELPTRVITKLSYGSVRAITRLVGAGIDGALTPIEALAGGQLDSEPGPEREALLAALNGVVGDYLAAQGSPLATPMTLRHAGRPLALDAASLRVALPHARSRALVLVHGSSMHDRQWSQRGHDHGAALADALGLTSIYVRYNTGLHVSTNGRELSGMLARLAAAWPVALEEIVLLGHSMGGLVARSACHLGEQTSAPWRGRVRALVTLGTPHHGAPLERLGNLAEPLLELSRYSRPLARLGRLRSAGITDLRYGNVRDEDWDGRDRFARGTDSRVPLPLPDGVRAYAVAGTTARVGDGQLPGDGLVSVESALGRHRDPRRCLAFPDAHQWIAHDTGHIALLASRAVCDKLAAWLAP